MILQSVSDVFVVLAGECPGVACRSWHPDIPVLSPPAVVVEPDTGWQPDNRGQTTLSDS